MGNDVWMPSIDDYLTNKETVRALLAFRLNISEKKVKGLINALLCGAKLGCNTQFSLTAMFDNDFALIKKIKSDAYIATLREEIKEMWSYIEADMPRKKKMSEKTKKMRLLAISSRDRWSLYFRLECEVRVAVCSYLAKKDIKYFYEHDGFSANKEIDIVELNQHVLERTGYDLTFSSAINEPITEGLETV